MSLDPDPPVIGWLEWFLLIGFAVFTVALVVVLAVLAGS